MIENSSDIYNALVSRVSLKEIHSRTRIVYDPHTGVQNTYFDNKLISINHIKSTPKIIFKC